MKKTFVVRSYEKCFYPIFFFYRVKPIKFLLRNIISGKILIIS